MENGTAWSLEGDALGMALMNEFMIDMPFLEMPVSGYLLEHAVDVRRVRLVRDFFFLAPPAFLGAFADFLEGCGHFVCFFSDVLEWRAARWSAHISGAWARR